MKLQTSQSLKKYTIFFFQLHNTHTYIIKISIPFHSELPLSWLKRQRISSGGYGPYTIQTLSLRPSPVTGVKGEDKDRTEGAEGGAAR